MKKNSRVEIVISGIGITSAIGQGKDAFLSGLMQAQNAFGVMKRPGRQKESSFIGAEIPQLSPSESLSKRLLRSASFSGQAAMITLLEAWKDARLDSVDPMRIGLIIGGSNVQQRELVLTYESYHDRIQYIRPTYALSFMDSDLCGLCTEQFGIKGLANTIGGASASGQLAVIRAAQAVQTGQVDICIAMGALMDISYMECHAFRGLGAMGTDKFSNEPAAACRPFDKNRDGFIYGEACGVVVVERASTAENRNIQPYAEIPGWAVIMDANKNPNPSYEGELYVVKKAMAEANLTAGEIDYINPHGTGSAVGDETELSVIGECQFSNAYINATKSITGHGLSAAGAVEVIATLLQMKEQKLHPTRNLEDPVQPNFHWVREKPVSHEIKHALSLSMGFGGINTAICLTKY